MGSMERREKPHALCIPYPAQGHVNPMLKLSKLLHFKGFHITFVNTEFNHNRLLRSRGPNSLNGTDGFSFETIPDGLPPSDQDATQNIPDLCDSITKNIVGPFRDLLCRLNNVSSDAPPVTHIVSDGVMTFTLQVAEEFKIPEILLWTASACGFMGYRHYRQLIERGITPFKDISWFSNGHLDMPIDWIPGMNNIRLRHLPSFFKTTDRDDIMLNYTSEEAQRAFKASAFIINTFDDLESGVLDAIKSMFPHWGVGMEIDDDVKREEVEKLIRELMEGERGKVMKGKALEWKMKAEKAVGQQGSSYLNMEKIVKQMLHGNLPSSGINVGPIADVIRFLLVPTFVSPVDDEMLLKDAKLLHFKGFYINFVNTEFNHKRLLRSRGPKALDGAERFRFDTIPDGLPPIDQDVTQSIPALCDSSTKNTEGPFRDLLNKLNDDVTSGFPPVTHILSDGVMSFTLDVAEEMNLPEVLFWTTSACGLLGYMTYRRLIERGVTPFKVMTDQQLVEFAWGLENCKKPFLWVIRPDLVNGDSAVLPEEFLSEIKERGMLASWCPQEQTTNCHYSCVEWGIGMEIDNDVKREGVEKLIRELMVGGEEGNAMKDKSLEWMMKARIATKKGGSSLVNLDKLVDEVLIQKQ
ncbi:UDP-glycosyltransferase 85A2 [Acorus calamus]|uniref:UDP-glycosyltransferase 85A2 n=1 Tax=Acorus calamus TaxID=4465 RepID=A0AAV9EPF6_ACOCL|nr:UDP-glycosyltransferase 85A2 [Acorus calamus]